MSTDNHDAEMRAALWETVDALHWWHMRLDVRDNLTPKDGPHCDNETCVRARAALGVSSAANAQDQHSGGPK